MCNSELTPKNLLNFYSCDCGKFRINALALIDLKEGLGYCSLFLIYGNLYLIYKHKHNSTNRVYFTFDGYEYNDVVIGLLNIDSLKYKEAPDIYNFSPMSVLELFEKEIKSIESNFIFL